MKHNPLQKVAYLIFSLCILPSVTHGKESSSSPVAPHSNTLQQKSVSDDAKEESYIKGHKTTKKTIIKIICTLGVTGLAIGGIVFPVKRRSPSKGKVKKQKSMEEIFEEIGLSEKICKDIKEDINIELDEEGNTVLHEAAGWGNLEAVKIFISKGANLNEINKYGYTPLYMAARSWQETQKVIEALIEAGADPNQKLNEQEDTVLHIIAQSGNINEMQRFINAARGKININAQNTKGDTALHNAVSWEVGLEIANINMLIKAGIEVNTENKEGQSALHKAVELGSYEAVTVLVNARGIDINIKDKNGKAPLDLAKTESIKELLTSQGGKKGHLIKDKQK